MTTAHTTNGKGHGCNPVPFQKHTTNNLDYTTGQRPGKASAMLKAQFARAGHLVHEGGNEDYIVVMANWCMSRPERGKCTKRVTVGCLRDCGS